MSTGSATRQCRVAAMSHVLRGQLSHWIAAPFAEGASQQQTLEREHLEQRDGGPDPRRE